MVALGVYLRDAQSIQLTRVLTTQRWVSLHLRLNMLKAIDIAMFKLAEHGIVSRNSALVCKKRLHHQMLSQ